MMNESACRLFHGVRGRIEQPRPLLRSGLEQRRTTLPREFTSATFRHGWEKGAAKLVELYTVFTYKQLV